MTVEGKCLKLVGQKGLSKYLSLNLIFEPNIPENNISNQLCDKHGEAGGSNAPDGKLYPSREINFFPLSYSNSNSQAKGPKEV